MQWCRLDRTAVFRLRRIVLIGDDESGHQDDVKVEDTGERVLAQARLPEGLDGIASSMC